MLAKGVKKVMLAVPEAKKYFENVDVVVTGNPVRGEILTADKAQSRAELKLDSRPVVLSFGGSLGARKINEAVAELVARSGKDGKYQHIHAYGSYGDWFPQLVKDKGADILVTSFPKYRYNLLKNNGDSNLDVIYFTELLAEALGLKEAK